MVYHRDTISASTVDHLPQAKPSVCKVNINYKKKKKREPREKGVNPTSASGWNFWGIILSHKHW